MVEIRLLEETDIKLGFTKIYNIINPTQIKKNDIEFYNDLNDNTYVYVAVFNDKIIGTATLIVCEKIIQRLALIEDVAVHPKYRKAGIGKMLIDFLMLEAYNMECYKVILTCKDDNVEFYKKCRMEVYQNCMCRKFIKL